MSVPGGTRLHLACTPRPELLAAKAQAADFERAKHKRECTQLAYIAQGDTPTPPSNARPIRNTHISEPPDHELPDFLLAVWSEYGFIVGVPISVQQDPDEDVSVLELLDCEGVQGYVVNAESPAVVLPLSTPGLTVRQRISLNLMFFGKAGGRDRSTPSSSESQPV